MPILERSLLAHAIILHPYNKYTKTRLLQISRDHEKNFIMDAIRYMFKANL